MPIMNKTEQIIFRTAFTNTTAIPRTDPSHLCYPFGFGLSYSEFRYDGLTLAGTQEGGLDVSYTVSNISARGGMEISQIYVRPVAPLVYRPDKELKGYAKSSVPAGGQVQVSVRLDRSAFSYWSVALDAWTVDDGIYEILVGASSSDIRLCRKVIIRGGELLV